MKITRKLLREYIQKLIKEEIVLPQSLRIKGKTFLIVNSLKLTTQMTDLLIQAQTGGSAGFGNYFENVVLESFPGEYLELNEGAGGPFPFADIFKNLTSGLGFYSVKMKRILDDSDIGGGDIKPNQLRSMLQHPTTISDFKNIEIQPGLIGGALEPTFFNDVKSIGLPIKIQIINPTENTPIFKLEEDKDAVLNPKEANKGILCVKSKSKNYAQEVLGTGINNQDYKYSTLTLVDDGFYKINGNDKIFKNDPNDDRIVNDPTALSILSSLLPFLNKLGFNDLLDYQIKHEGLSKKNKVAAERSFDVGTFAVFNTLYKAYESAKSTAKRQIENPTKPNKTATGTYDLFNQRIMEGTGKFEEPIYLLLTGGYSSATAIKNVLDGKELPMPNTKVLIDRIKKILSFQVFDIKDKGKPIANRILEAFSRQQLIDKVKTIDSENFPDGFFIAFKTDKSLTYALPESIDFPFDRIGSQDLISTLKDYAAEGGESNPEYDKILQGINAADLPDKIPKSKIKPDLANKVLSKIAIEIYVGEINNFEIPYSNPNSKDVEEFKAACKEFSLLKQLSDDSQSSSVLTEEACKTIEQNIINYRINQIIPLAQKVLPDSMMHAGEQLTKNQILKRLGLNESILKERQMQTAIPAGIETLNSAKIESVLSMIFEMADLLTLILKIAAREPMVITNTLKSYLNEGESKIYQKVVLELLKHSK